MAYTAVLLEWTGTTVPFPGRRERSWAGVAKRKPKSAVVHECNAHGVVPVPTVFRDKPAVIGGRMYPPTARTRLEDEDTVFDLIASLYAVVHGEVTGPCADILTVICHAWLQRCPVGFPFLEDIPASCTALRVRAACLFANGVYGRDKHGGYVAATAIKLMDAPVLGIGMSTRPVSRRCHRHSAVRPTSPPRSSRPSGERADGAPWRAPASRPCLSLIHI